MSYRTVSAKHPTDCPVCFRTINMGEATFAHKERGGDLHPIELKCLSQWMANRFQNNLDPTCPSGTALAFAARSNDLSSVQELLRSATTWADGDFNFAILIAVENGHLDIVEEFLQMNTSLQTGIRPAGLAIIATAAVAMRTKIELGRSLSTAKELIQENATNLIHSVMDPLLEGAVTPQDDSL